MEPHMALSKRESKRIKVCKDIKMILWFILQWHYICITVNARPSLRVTLGSQDLDPQGSFMLIEGRVLVDGGDRIQTGVGASKTGASSALFVPRASMPRTMSGIQEVLQESDGRHTCAAHLQGLSWRETYIEIVPVSVTENDSRFTHHRGCLSHRRTRLGNKPLVVTLPTTRGSAGALPQPLLSFASRWLPWTWSFPLHKQILLKMELHSLQQPFKMVAINIIIIISIFSTFQTRKLRLLAWVHAVRINGLSWDLNPALISPLSLAFLFHP